MPRSQSATPNNGLRAAQIFCALAHALGFLVAASARAEPSAPPITHVFLIVVDTLRADHLSPYGYTRDTSPFLGELAKESVLFENAYSASSFTRESVSAMFTGAFPSAAREGAGWNALPAQRLTTLAETFQQAGYATALYADTPMIEDPAFARGFDEAKCLPEYNRSLLGPKVIEQAKAFLEKNRDRNTFLYLHLMDPHSPYDPPDDLYARFGGPRPANAIELDTARGACAALRKEGFGPGEARFEDLVCAYDGEIAFQDRLLEEFAGWLKQQGMWDRSLIAFTADHGEEFLEHGFLEHAWRLYVESLHVPLMLWAGPRFVPGREKARASNIGLYPTLCAVAGLGTGDRAFDYDALLGRAEDGWRASVSDRPIISELQLPERCMLRSVILDGHHYIAAQQWFSAEQCSDVCLVGVQRRLRQEYASGVRARPAPWGPVVREELYDLEADPTEQHDVLSGGGPALEACRAALDAYRARCVPTP